MKLLVFAASHRPQSFNRQLAMLAARHMAALGVNIDFAEYGEFDMPIYNDAIAMPGIAHAFADRAAQADGIVISSPEYNWSYPGSLKNIIDWTSCINPNPIKGRTALLMSATPGSRGGILGLNHLKPPLESSELFVFPKVFPLGHCHQAFNADGMLADDAHQKLFTTILDDYVTFTGKLTHS